MKPKQLTRRQRKAQDRQIAREIGWTVSGFRHNRVLGKIVLIGITAKKSVIAMKELAASINILKAYVETLHPD